MLERPQPVPPQAFHSPEEGFAAMAAGLFEAMTSPSLLHVLGDEALGG